MRRVMETPGLARILIDIFLLWNIYKLRYCQSIKQSELETIIIMISEVKS